MTIVLRAGKGTWTKAEIRRGVLAAMAEWAAKKRKPSLAPGSPSWKKYLGHFGPPRRKKGVVKKAAAKKAAVKKTAKAKKRTR